MVYKLAMTIYKEMLLLKRDLGGLVILFVMPLMLIITVTLIQDASFKSMDDLNIPILLVDNDHGEISKTVKEDLNKNGNFQVISQLKGKIINEEMAREAVFKGEYQLAIILPQDLSTDLNSKVQRNVERIMQSMEVNDSNKAEQKKEVNERSVKLYFDPASQISFRNTVKNSIDKLITNIEKEKVYQGFQESLGISDFAIQDENFISYQVIGPDLKSEEEILPNSVQHNVPAWSLFAIFFIIVPLSINIVKEKGQGTQIRLITNPVPHFVLIAGKTITYLIICMLQFMLMLLIGLFLFPYMGLPKLELQGTFLMLFIVTLFSGLAAVGLGILLGTIAKTQEQAAPFAATFVVILAAIGGIWVPVFAMPKIMQSVSRISPMNWGLDAYYDVLLRKAGFGQIALELLLLFSFFLITVLVALFYDKKKRAV
ncbi:MAG: ABC transporter permease [Crocinitomicaceae bacterium]|nr:ABC transporter permease [Crocinitomicaceae bacterium]